MSHESNEAQKQGIIQGIIQGRKNNVYPIHVS